MSFEERFWAKVERGDSDECWRWSGTLTRGYGVLGRGGRGAGNVTAHRAAYELLVGPVPDFLHHVCGNKACVNPAHLRPVTQAEHNTLHRKCAHAERYTQSDGRSVCRACKREKERERWKDSAYRDRKAAYKRARRLRVSEP